MAMSRRSTCPNNPSSSTRRLPDVGVASAPGAMSAIHEPRGSWMVVTVSPVATSTPTMVFSTSAPTKTVPVSPLASPTNVSAEG